MPPNEHSKWVMLLCGNNTKIFSRNIRLSSQIVDEIEIEEKRMYGMVCLMATQIDDDDVDTQMNRPHDRTKWKQLVDGPHKNEFLC